MRWLLLVVSASLALTPTSSLAHSGGIDGNSCHTNRKTGDFHCHGGRAPSMEGGSTGRGSGPSINDDRFIRTQKTLFQLHEEKWLL